MASYTPVYSVEFINATPGAGGEAFDVPDGFTAVIREFDLYTEAGDTTYVLSKQDSEIAPVLTFAALSLTGSIISAQWTGRVVVPAGGVISIYGVTIGEGASVTVNGYLLRNTLA